MDDHNIPAISSKFEEFDEVKKIKQVNVYGVQNRDGHDKFAVYITGYEDLPKLREHLKNRGFTIYEGGVGVYENSKDVSVGFNKRMRDKNPTTCAKIVWVVHTTC